MIPLIPIAISCMGALSLILSNEMNDKKVLKKYREKIRQLEDTIEDGEHSIRDSSELLEALRKDFDEFKDCYSEVEIVRKKREIREFEESIEKLKQCNKKLEENKKIYEEAVTELETKLKD